MKINQVLRWMGWSVLPIVVLVACVLSTPAQAETYVGLSTGTAFGDIVAPTGDAEDTRLGGVTSASVGYRAATGTYVEAALTNLGVARRGALAPDARNERTEDARAVEVRVGRAFRLTPEFELYAEGGGARVSADVTERAEQLTTGTVTEVSSATRDTVVTYGAGFALTPTDAVRVRFGATRYAGGLDRTVVTVGVTLGF